MEYLNFLPSANVEVPLATLSPHYILHTQLLRLLANLSVEARVGAVVASHKEIVEALLTILGKRYSFLLCREIMPLVCSVRVTEFPRKICHNHEALFSHLAQKFH